MTAVTEATAFDVIVIGSGIGGLACAVAPSRSGRTVLVLEQHFVAGGLTQTFSPDAIADAYWDMHHQNRSAWTLELDVRPSSEDF
jgi:flavin-dependent dehydrogenase